MTPYYADDWLTIYAGDCRDVLPTLPAESVDCIVTSPPFWGLRDYGHPGQLGLEPTPEQYVANLVAVFRELRRVLKASGTCWLNLGDSYNSIGGTFGSPKHAGTLSTRVRQADTKTLDGGLKPKDLVGIPWRVAFALQADGWYLRSDIIWSKPNPMPESVTDRPTKNHEYLFLLTRSPRYYFDADAVREPIGEWSEQALRSQWMRRSRQAAPGSAWDGAGKAPGVRYDNGINPNGRNLRSVWTIATRPYPGAHFAVFPPELPERCIKAGSSERGVCPECGKPWERVVERETRFEGGSGKAGRSAAEVNGSGKWAGIQYGENIKLGPVVTSTTIGWRPTCRHETLRPTSAVILDPFAGSGTVGLVANRLSRRAILIDLNPDYIRQQLRRNHQVPVGL